MTTRLVLCTSRPMLPAEVDNSKLASLMSKYAMKDTNLSFHLPLSVTVNNFLFVASGIVPRKLLINVCG